MEVRRYYVSEEKEIWQLYFDTTHKIISRFYTEAQCKRWAPPNKDIAEWTDRLKSKKPFVALEENKIVGFAELDPDGHIDMFYCHHKWQRKGVGTQLYSALENEAKNMGIGRLYAESSMAAVEFFKSKGFEITEERTNIVCDSPAKQFLVSKKL